MPNKIVICTCQANHNTTYRNKLRETRKETTPPGIINHVARIHGRCVVDATLQYLQHTCGNAASCLVELADVKPVSATFTDSR